MSTQKSYIPKYEKHRKTILQPECFFRKAWTGDYKAGKCNIFTKHHVANSTIFFLKAKGKVYVCTFLHRPQLADLEVCKYGIALFPRNHYRFLETAKTVAGYFKMAHDMQRWATQCHLLTQKVIQDHPLQATSLQKHTLTSRP